MQHVFSSPQINISSKGVCEGVPRRCQTCITPPPSGQNQSLFFLFVSRVYVYQNNILEKKRLKLILCKDSTRTKHTWYWTFHSICKTTPKKDLIYHFTSQRLALIISSDENEKNKTKKIEPVGTVLPTAQQPGGRGARWHDADWTSYMWNYVCTLLEPNTEPCSREETGKRTPVPQCAGGGRRGSLHVQKVCNWLSCEAWAAPQLAAHAPFPVTLAHSRYSCSTFFVCMFSCRMTPLVTSSGLCVFSITVFFTCSL